MKVPGVVLASHVLFDRDVNVAIDGVAKRDGGSVA